MHRTVQRQHLKLETLWTITFLTVRRKGDCTVMNGKLTHGTM